MKRKTKVLIIVTVGLLVVLGASATYLWPEFLLTRFDRSKGRAALLEHLNLSESDCVSQRQFSTDELPRAESVVFPLGLGRSLCVVCVPDHSSSNSAGATCYKRCLSI